MKASEVISALRKLVEEHGNLEVEVANGGFHQPAIGINVDEKLIIIES